MAYTAAAAAAGTDRPAATAAKIKTASHTKFLTAPTQARRWSSNVEPDSICLNRRNESAKPVHEIGAGPGPFFCLLPFAFCLLPFAFCLLPFDFCLLPSAFCLLPFAFCLLPFAFCLLPFDFCLLPSAFCLLPFAFCLLPFAFCLSFIPLPFFPYSRSLP
jgi:hypothetical protein